MAEQFEVAELVAVGVEDEKSGVAFYSLLAERAGSAELRATFADLARQESFHQKRFERMLADLGGMPAREEYAGQYLAYVRVLTEERAFPDPQTARRMAEQCAGDDAKAVDLALRFERDTLLLMNEMRVLVPARDQKVIDELTREEKAHVVALVAARDRQKK
jgi:rubrerythrin